MDNTKILESKMNEKADIYQKKFASQIKALEESLIAKTRGVQLADIYALGEQLTAWDTYMSICEEEGSTNLLGKLPLIAYDVITATYGVSILSAIAGVQPIEEERGTVYFNNTRAETTKGNVTSGDLLSSPTQLYKTPQGFASNLIQNEVGAVTTSGTTYTFTLAGKPIRSESLKITIQSDTTVFCQDFGQGKLYGIGLSGIVDYLTGVVTLVFAVEPTTGKNIYCEYQQNLELATDLPEISTFFDTKPISAQIYALKGTVGMLQSYGMKKRFGIVAEDEMSKNLVTETNKEVGGDLIRKIVANAQGSTTWNKRAPTGVSYFEHKMTLIDYLANAESVLVTNAGRGSASVYIAGASACAILSTFPNFEKLSDGNTLGAHIYGKLNGVTVVRVLETALVPAYDIYIVYRGTSPFDAAAIYAPFMPLTVTATLPMAPNPLKNMKAAAIWAGVDVVIKNFITKLSIVDEAY